jgi:predicted  nucleic acid-binding Zn-ribbon protein
VAEKVALLDKARKGITSKETVLKNKKEELDKIIAATEKEERHFAKLSADAREKIEPRLLHSYDRIRSNYRNGLAVVPIVRDACGGCFNAIPPQRQSEIRQRKKIIVCENCGRILVDNDLNDGVEVK